MKEFNLSDKIIDEGIRYPESYLKVEDVKKFIKNLKDRVDDLKCSDNRIPKDILYLRINNIISELAGEILK